MRDTYNLEGELQEVRTLNVCLHVVDPGDEEMSQCQEIGRPKIAGFLVPQSHLMGGITCFPALSQSRLAARSPNETHLSGQNNIILP